MLAMLARFGHVGKPGPVDVRHMGRPCAGDQGQLLLMTLTRLSQGQLTLMMLAGFGHVRGTRGNG